MSLPETTWKLAAQPCSYIYPIYSVVKNHGATWLGPYCYVIAIAPLGGLSIPAQGSTSEDRRSNLKQTSLVFVIEDANRDVSGGAERDRTVDPLLAKQVLSQLSYSPMMISITERQDKGGGPG